MTLLQEQYRNFAAVLSWFFSAQRVECFISPAILENKWKHAQFTHFFSFNMQELEEILHPGSSLKLSQAKLSELSSDVQKKEAWE